MPASKEAKLRATTTTNISASYKITVLGGKLRRVAMATSTSVKDLTKSKTRITTDMITRSMPSNTMRENTISSASVILAVEPINAITSINVMTNVAITSVPRSGARAHVQTGIMNGTTVRTSMHVLLPQRRESLRRTGCKSTIACKHSCKKAKAHA